VDSPAADADRAAPPAIISPPRASLPPPPVDPGASEDLFRLELIGRYALFTLRSIRRHKLLFALVCASIMGMAVAALAVLPKTYHAETTLQAQRNQVIPSLSNPHRSMPGDADAPTRYASETVLRYDNLVALMEQTEFIKKWPLNRAPILRVKDWIYARLFKPETPEQRIETFVYYLRNRLSVWTGDGTVTISVELPDRQLAYQIVDTAMQNFLASRYASEVAIIEEAITILETRAGQAYESLSTSLQQLRSLREERRARLGKQAEASGRAAAPVPAPDPAATQLKVILRSKRRAMADLEESRRRRVTELQLRLQEQKATYSESHPAVLTVQESISALEQDSPQMIALRREIAQLEEDAKKRGLIVDGGGDFPRSSSHAVREAQLEWGDPRESEDPQIEYAREQVRRDLFKYTDFLDRLEGARLELDTARAAFKHRYAVIRPVTWPRAPTRPSPIKVLGASFVASLLFAALAAALRERYSPPAPKN
jgi:hypothetical protein